MATNRRTPSRGSHPRGQAGPGRGSGGRTPVRAPEAATPRPQRPRFTGRAAILILVLAVLAVSYASSFRAYLQQREHIGDLRSRIEATGESIDQLEREKRRWADDAYVSQQARLYTWLNNTCTTTGIHSSLRTIDVRDPDVYATHPPLEATKGERQSAGRVLAQRVARVSSANANQDFTWSYFVLARIR